MGQWNVGKCITFILLLASATDEEKFDNVQLDFVLFIIS